MIRALPSPSHSRAFSLVELLTVIAIAVAIMAIVGPAVAPLFRASKVTTAASLLTDNINLARQTALTQNMDVEMRIYKTASGTDATNLQYRAFRLFKVDPDNGSVPRPLGKTCYLPEPAIIAESTSLSTLLDYTNTSRSGLTRGEETLPGTSTQISYVSFRFRANGGTNLTPVNPPDGNWYLTIYLQNDPKAASTGIPANYFTAQIDPVTGRVRGYRP